jgi:hypothetical protein
VAESGPKIVRYFLAAGFLIPLLLLLVISLVKLEWHRLPYHFLTVGRSPACSFRRLKEWLLSEQTACYPQTPERSHCCLLRRELSVRQW